MKILFEKYNLQIRIKKLCFAIGYNMGYDFTVFCLSICDRQSDYKVLTLLHFKVFQVGLYIGLND